MTLAPPFTDPAHVLTALRERGYAVLAPEAAATRLGVPLRELDALAPSWDDLPADAHLLDGGRYRFRRHASFRVDEGRVARAPHRAHWQPLDYNALHGGIERWFEPIEPRVAASRAFERILAGLAVIFSSSAGERTWFVEAHQFRIDTAGGIGRPTPEGAHRDGVDFVALFLVQRRDVKGGETRVFEARGPAGIRFTIEEPWTLLVLDDARVIHETTPIQPSRGGGVRDTLVVTFRAGGFQDRA